MHIGLGKSSELQKTAKLNNSTLKGVVGKTERRSHSLTVTQRHSLLALRR